MSILRDILGPKSKYDHRLPCTYEARVRVTGVEGISERCSYRDRKRETDGPFVEFDPPEPAVKAGKS